MGMTQCQFQRDPWWCFGFCTVWYALYFLKMRAFPVFDPMHVPCRDLDGWMAEANLNCSMNLKSIYHKVGSGPWDGESWMQQHRDCAQEASAMELTDEPCLEFFWPQISRELGLVYEQTTVVDKLQLLRELPESDLLKKQGPRVCGTRWRTYSEA